MRHRARPVTLLCSLAFVGVAMGGCHDRAPRHTAGAVGTAIQRVQSTMASAMDPRGVPGVAQHGDSASIPNARVQGLGLGAHAIVQDDAAHQNVAATRTGEGWALSWNDPERTRAFVARMDPEGRPTGRPMMVRESHSDEEDVVAPAVASNGSEMGVAWVDPANGALRFKRMSASGQSMGRPTMIHDGLEMPRATRIAWNGSEYGIAVALPTGVYFARVNREGARVGRGVMVAEDTAVGGIDELTASSSGFQVAWHEAGESAGVRHEARITRDGQVVSTLPSSIRVATR
jgi:hypothetical protein